jgi:4-hydroxybenzoate-CoA ligase/benzoate-CoA ligase
VIYNAFSDFIRKSDYIAIYYKDQKITYNDLYDNVSRYSNKLSETLNQGDEILIMLNDSPEYFYIFWGAIKSGILPMLLNNKLSDNEKEQIIKKYNPKLIITDENIKSFDLNATNTTDNNIATTSKDDICFYLFSSGTTGYIKRCHGSK